MKTQRKIWNFIKGIFYLVPTLVIIVVLLSTFFTNFGYSIQETSSSIIPMSFTYLYNNFIDFIDLSMHSLPTPFTSAIISPLRDFISWVNINLFNNSFGLGNTALDYIWVQVAWYIQARLMFILFDALLFIINFAENMLNKTYRK